MNKGFLWVDARKCVACGTCELQCALAHSQSGSLSEVIVEIPRSLPRLKVEAGPGFSVPLQCRHCEDAPCIKICPSRALAKSEHLAPVLLNNERCIGCRFCIQVCPFGVIWMNKQGTGIVKCDLCIGRLNNGELPACAAGCPTHAITFTSIQEYATEMRKKTVEQFLVELK